VPRTLVTQSRDEVVSFVREVGRVIVKPVVGASGPLMFTRFLDDPESSPEPSFAVCPAIYQEYIPDSHHIRLNCFGENMYAPLIETDDLDWRPNLNVPISGWTVPQGAPPSWSPASYTALVYAWGSSTSNSLRKENPPPRAVTEAAARSSMTWRHFVPGRRRSESREIVEVGTRIRSRVPADPAPGHGCSGGRRNDHRMHHFRHAERRGSPAARHIYDQDNGHADLGDHAHAYAHGQRG
jgi:hypothetical protein